MRFYYSNFLSTIWVT